MMKFASLSGACVLLVTLTTGCGGGDKGGETTKTDKEKIVGVWVLEVMACEGSSITVDKTKERKLVMTADKMIHEGLDDPIRAFFRMTKFGLPNKIPPGKDDPINYTLDPSKSPKHIDMWKNKDKEDAIKGIYSLEGDTLKIAYDTSGNINADRPTEIKSSKDSHVMLLIWKREEVK